MDPPRSPARRQTDKRSSEIAVPARDFNIHPGAGQADQCVAKGRGALAAIGSAFKEFAQFADGAKAGRWLSSSRFCSET